MSLRQTDRQTHCFFFLMNFRGNSFFSMEGKKGSKNLSIAIFGALTEEDIDIIHQRDFNIV